MVGLMEGFFEYPFRWQQIFGKDEASQIAMLEERDRSIEQFFHLGGSCPLELPYRWDQIWPALLLGEDWAIACAEENDRVIEGLFSACDCPPVSVLRDLYISGPAVPDFGTATYQIETYNYLKTLEVVSYSGSPDSDIYIRRNGVLFQIITSPTVSVYAVDEPYSPLDIVSVTVDVHSGSPVTAEVVLHFLGDTDDAAATWVNI